MAATGSKMLPKFDVVQMESLISPLIKLIKLFKKYIVSKYKKLYQIKKTYENILVIINYKI